MDLSASGDYYPDSLRLRLLLFLCGGQRLLPRRLSQPADRALRLVLHVAYPLLGIFHTTKNAPDLSSEPHRVYSRRLSRRDLFRPPTLAGIDVRSNRHFVSHPDG